MNDLHKSNKWDVSEKKNAMIYQIDFPLKTINNRRWTRDFYVKLPFYNGLIDLAGNYRIVLILTQVMV